MNDGAPDQPDQGTGPHTADLVSARLEVLRTRLTRRTQKLHVATEALKMARLAALYEMAEILEADHPAAAARVRDHILSTGEIPEGFALSFEQVADLIFAEDDSVTTDAP